MGKWAGVHWKMGSCKQVRKLTHGVIDGLDRATGLGVKMGLTGEPHPHGAGFNYGWAHVPRDGHSPHVNFWSG
jgi:hypothetical protein